MSYYTTFLAILFLAVIISVVLTLRVINFKNYIYRKMYYKCKCARIYRRSPIMKAKKSAENGVKRILQKQRNECLYSNMQHRCINRVFRARVLVTAKAHSYLVTAWLVATRWS